MMNRYVIMGVSGCGKSSIGAAFATAIGGRHAKLNASISIENPDGERKFHARFCTAKRLARK